MIGNHDVEFPASSQTISAISSGLRTLHLVAKVMDSERGN